MIVDSGVAYVKTAMARVLISADIPLVMFPMQAVAVKCAFTTDMKQTRVQHCQDKRHLSATPIQTRLVCVYPRPAVHLCAADVNTVGPCLSII